MAEEVYLVVETMTKKAMRKKKEEDFLAAADYLEVMMMRKAKKRRKEGYSAVVGYLVVEMMTKMLLMRGCVAELAICCWRWCDVGACGVVGGGDGVASFVADVLSLVTGI